MSSFKLTSSKDEVSGETKKCPECLADIPKEAKKCSHCGTKQKQEVTPKQVLGTIIIMVFFVIMVVSLSGGDDTPKPEQTTASDTQAHIMAENYVETVLKSPSTADFPSLDYNYFDLGNNKHKIVSYVDSQNGFGAMVRSEWSVILTYNGGDWSNSNNWTLNELIFDGEVVYAEESTDI